MSDSRPSTIWIFLAGQLVLALGGLATLALAPPVQGAMMLVPLTRGTSAVRLARDGGALLVAGGPRGSVIVRGDRAALFWPLMREGVLTIAAPAGYCGSAS